ncbi:MAG: bifunctional diaminohydroxyphosphoribosylaminopyrimidine deaminase/5-amino-6-(5-phosphoribosylamino)uracil reductase RibD [Planctomycetota bacterium]
MSKIDEKFMHMALKLARRGIGSVEPNPAVGCVIVKGDNIIGKGWHKKFTGPHAEINALSDCKKNGNNPEGAAMYVTLEPCCHQGKTQCQTLHPMLPAEESTCFVMQVSKYRPAFAKTRRNS